ncbi:hypothetical protein HAX54_046058, partial [Datura stramonium]|nr:hypothetical protein [Datura stramonium]
TAQVGDRKEIGIKITPRKSRYNSKIVGVQDKSVPWSQVTAIAFVTQRCIKIPTLRNSKSPQYSRATELNVHDFLHDMEQCPKTHTAKWFGERTCGFEKTELESCQ